MVHSFPTRRSSDLAANPGRVREIVPIDFPSPRRLTLRESADFVQRVAHLRRVLESC